MTDSVFEAAEDLFSQMPGEILERLAGADCIPDEFGLRKVVTRYQSSSPIWRPPEFAR
jgi:hypothetical protein